MKSGFLGKLIDRLDRLDPSSVQTQFLKIVRERGLLETIFQAIQEGVIAVDGEGRIRYANRAAETMIGFSFDSAHGRPASRYLRGIDWDRVLNLDSDEWSRLIRAEIEISYPEPRFVSFYVVPLSSVESVEKGAVLILRDVTRERENEATVLESERLNAVKLLAAGVAHEVGNPLNALNIHLQLLGREIRGLPRNVQDRLGELVAIAGNEVARLDLIITQFLRAIRPSKPKLVLSHVVQLIEETLNLLRLEIQGRNIRVVVDCQNSVPKVRVDRNQMKQAFFNLIRNAFQAMPDGGQLTVSVSSSDKAMGICFRDTGKGIRAEDLGRVFDPYYTTREEGSGLGLMIVQRIVQDHGGQIEVMSKPGVGTAFTVVLPLAERRIRLLRAGRVRAGDGPAAPGAAAEDHSA